MSGRITLIVEASNTAKNNATQLPVERPLRHVQPSGYLLRLDLVLHQPWLPPRLPGEMNVHPGAGNFISQLII